MAKRIFERVREERYAGGHAQAGEVCTEHRARYIITEPAGD